MSRKIYHIYQRKLKRYRHIWGLFLNMPTRAVAKRIGVTVPRIYEIVNSYARIRRFRLSRQFPEPIIGINWSARYNYSSGAEHKARR